MLELLDIHVQKKNDPDLYYTPCIKINSKFTADLNVNVKLYNYQKKTQENNLHDLGLGKEFLDMTSNTTQFKNGPSSKFFKKHFF